MDAAVSHPGRSSFLARYWVVQAVAIMSAIAAVGWNRETGWRENLQNPELIGWSVGMALAVTLLQAVFLLPISHRAAGRGPGVAMGLRLAGVGVVIALMAAGGAAILVDVVKLFRDDFNGKGNAGGLAVLSALLVAWLVATPLLFVYMRRTSPDSFLSRIAKRLFYGTMIEFIAALPVAMMVSRRSRCYCAEASIWAVTFLGILGFIVMGPAVLIPVLGRRRRRT